MLHTLHNRFRLLFYIFFYYLCYERALWMWYERKLNTEWTTRDCSISHFKRRNHMCVCVYSAFGKFGLRLFTLFSLISLNSLLFILYSSVIFASHTHMNSPLALKNFGLAAWLTHNGRFSGFLQLLLLLSLSCFIFIPLSLCVCVVDNLHTCFMWLCPFVCKYISQ